MISFISCRVGALEGPTLFAWPVSEREGDLLYYLTLELALYGCCLRQEPCEGRSSRWPVLPGDLLQAGGATAFPSFFSF